MDARCILCDAAMLMPEQEHDAADRLCDDCRALSGDEQRALRERVMLRMFRES